MWLGLLLFAFGLSLSALFSGSEMGFYRASRLKITMDAQEGGRLSRLLKLFIQQPGAFLSLVLIGNNCANYLLSFALVLVSQHYLRSHPVVFELMATPLMTPIVFVYGELLPKSVFFQAPNRLLRWATPALCCCAIVLAPAIIILWGLSRFTEWVFGQAPERVSMALAREELQRALDEGQRLGILNSAQRVLAQNFAEAASRPVRVLCTPLPRLPTVSVNHSIAAAIRTAQIHGIHQLAVTDATRSEIIGYVRLADLLVSTSPERKLTGIRPLVECRAEDPLGEVILRLQTQRETLARVVNEQRQTIGVVSLNQLIDPLLKGPLGSLRR